jgi:hypothetical protein
VGAKLGSLSSAVRRATGNRSSGNGTERGDGDAVEKITPSDLGVHAKIAIVHDVGMTNEEPSLIDDGHIAVVDFIRV